MLSVERQNEILEILMRKRCASVEELERALFASGATVRRDLAQMEKRGLLQRVRGGAARLESAASDAPLLVRAGMNREKKECIARLALPLVQNARTLFIDSSSTATALARKLGERALSVMTNGFVTLGVLGELPEVRTYCTGGLLHNHSAFVGQAAIDTVNSFQADCLFFSCCGLSRESGTLEAGEENAAVKKAMLRSAKRRVLLCDSTKLDADFFFRVCPLESLDVVVTDKRPEDGFLETARCRFLYP